MTLNRFIIFSILLTLFSCTQKTEVKTATATNAKGQVFHADKPYIQEYSIRYYLSEDQTNQKISAVSADRNNHIHVLSNHEILVPDNGQLFYSGQLIRDLAYTPMLAKKISAITTYKNHTVYLDNKHVFSNSWAGKIQIDHGLPKAQFLAAGKDFHFLVSDGNNLVYVNADGEQLWSGKFADLKELKYHEAKNRFILVSSKEVAEFLPSGNIKSIYKGAAITCAQPLSQTDKIAIGTTNGYLIYPENKRITKVPCPEITCINEIEGELWFGSAFGAFKLNNDGKYRYYAGERWLPGNEVSALAKGPESSILVTTNKGLAKITFEEMTLEEKALFYEKQVREKNIRYGFNCCVSQLPNGYSTATMTAQASDNLWTGMYLASQLFRYKVTGDESARQNAYEAFEAMERLHTITGIDGLFARGFERDYKVENTKTEGWEARELKTGSPATMWLRGNDHPNWTWRSTVSSDQTVGQVFALTLILELVEDEDWRHRALKYLDDLMGYIVENDMYIIDVDGEPTLWGKWNPDYVNGFPTNVGDRRLYSSNIIAFLQTAYKYTGKEKYKDKAYELMNEYGYLENLVRPISEIGPSNADEWSKHLSEEWNHSDDEMYFLAYWSLYPDAFTPELKTKFEAAIKDHWEIERPEKNALWNFCYSMTGAKDFDLDESIEFLQQYPLDLRHWGMKNSQRQDVEYLPDNFRGQTTKELLPLQEIPLYRHNGQIFKLDCEGNGSSLVSAGDTWLLPYWMGRYLGVISAPQPK
ncbi:hypothetical protein OU798_03780 [Prolixibacteraceae bacterium Z1-6]|uniref:Uncharacterized protein n=1 Tax=Draconibacterium aestuarii TaxID=2998507 RepID=A0A9X3J6A6_9BACT|nr:hypothetical protein [Prolixibacteraceae bacterium Z1-6]